MATIIAFFDGEHLLYYIIFCDKICSVQKLGKGDFALDETFELLQLDAAFPDVA